MAEALSASSTSSPLSVVAGDVGPVDVVGAVVVFVVVGAAVAMLENGSFYLILKKMSPGLTSFQQ